ncbi:glycosyltransferase family 4 protein [candidate division KSB1 bacterium]|nr:glycosyltransferase family 4 protein [candidate division KSB1 bacterium]
MKIVGCNMRYFVSGGPERYIFGLKKILESHGHEFIPFSVAYQRNEPTPFQKYFVAPPGDPAQIYFKDLSLSLAQKLKFGLNAIYSFEAKRKLMRLIRDTRPDLLQTFQIHTFLSYSIIDAAAELGIPIVSRMSNYQLLCPAELFLRDQKVCEACKSSLWPALHYKCIQNSTLPSLIRVASLALHRRKHTFNKIARFIVPSRFLREKMIEYHFPAEKIVHVPSFIDTELIQPNYSYDGYIAYSGRLAVEKGIQDLIDGFMKLKTRVRLLLIGDVRNPEAERLQQYVAARNFDRIEFLGYQKLAPLEKILKGAMFTVCPSRWYENTPMSIYESFALGKPVLGANLGSIPEQILPGQTGLLFEPGNAEDIAEKIDYLITNARKLPEMGQKARQLVEQRHSPAVHYTQLMEIYRQALP